MTRQPGKKKDRRSSLKLLSRPPRSPQQPRRFRRNAIEPVPKDSPPVLHPHILLSDIPRDPGETKKVQLQDHNGTFLFEFSVGFRDVDFTYISQEVVNRSKVKTRPLGPKDLAALQMRASRLSAMTPTTTPTKFALMPAVYKGRRVDMKLLIMDIPDVMKQDIELGSKFLMKMDEISTEMEAKAEERKQPQQQQEEQGQRNVFGGRSSVAPSDGSQEQNQYQGNHLPWYQHQLQPQQLDLPTAIPRTLEPLQTGHLSPVSQPNPSYTSPFSQYAFRAQPSMSFPPASEGGWLDYGKFQLFQNGHWTGVHDNDFDFSSLPIPSAYSPPLGNYDQGHNQCMPYDQYQPQYQPQYPHLQQPEQPWHQAQNPHEQHHPQEQQPQHQPQQWQPSQQLQQFQHGQPPQ